jgi:hypothetical protein
MEFLAPDMAVQSFVLRIFRTSPRAVAAARAAVRHD